MRIKRAREDLILSRENAEQKTGNLLEARENANDQVEVGFSLHLIG